MAKDLKAKKYEIDVIFDAALAAADPFSYRGDVNGIGKDFQLLIDQNLGWIDLHLKTQNAKDDAVAVFSTDVIQWLSAQGTPDPTPAAFAVQRTQNDLATLININRVELRGSQVTFNFEIGVVYKGKTYTSPDPTIINVDPTGGGGVLVDEPVPEMVSAVS